MSLVDDVVERILVSRELYILFRKSRDYRPTRDCLGVYGRRVDAQRSALRALLRELDFNLYDPAKRFEHVESNRYDYAMHQAVSVETWNDRWTHALGVSTYEIEEWKQERSDGLLGRQGVTRAFDAMLKDKIVNDAMSSSDTRAMLLQWKQREKVDMFLDLFDATQARRIWPGDARARHTREEWQAIHGHVDAYPSGPDLDLLVA